MNASDCFGFEDAGSFLKAAENWKKFDGKATYLVVCGRQIPRLQGDSDILYIGQTVNLGGNVNSRLWNYNSAGKNNSDYRIKECVKKLEADGNTVFLRICQGPPDGQTVKEYESQLLSRYGTEHWELPPCNSQR